MKRQKRNFRFIDLLQNPRGLGVLGNEKTSIILIEILNIIKVTQEVRSQKDVYK